MLESHTQSYPSPISYQTGYNFSPGEEGVLMLWGRPKKFSVIDKLSIFHSQLASASCLHPATSHRHPTASRLCLPLTGGQNIIQQTGLLCFPRLPVSFHPHHNNFLSLFLLMMWQMMSSVNFSLFYHLKIISLHSIGRGRGIWWRGINSFQINSRYMSMTAFYTVPPYIQIVDFS